jgi:RNA-directed DNA polymerase
MLIETMARSLSVTPRLISKLATTASHRYKHFTVKKAGGGERDIYHPAKDLKGVQRWLQAAVVSSFPVHNAAAAYRRRMNIADHATRHLKSRYLLRVDLADFFESITAKDIASYLADHLASLPPGWNASDTELFTQLVCRYERLTIGAITSPGLSNAILLPLDQTLAKACKDLNAIYTRYADDMFFSTMVADVLGDVPAVVEKTLKSIPYPVALKINKSKTRHSSLKRRRRVTGLILSTQGHVSLGRQFKRGVRTQVYEMDGLGVPERRRLAGLLAFVKDVEPEFFNRLALKYGEKVSKAAHFKG